MKETLDYLNSLLVSGDTIVIGLSGGPDSMCLLNLLTSLKKDITIVCAHINHNIREESHDELKFIEEYCKEKKLIVETIIFDKKSPEKDYNELELREKRYAYFETIIKKYNAKYLFTAHHGDDLIETILMRITRGSNLKGYAGFQIETDKYYYKIIKPLVFTTKDEINAYNKKYNIPYVTDKTNEEDNYTRNRYRHYILPFLKKENPNIHTKYIKFSKELMKYYNYIDNVVQKEISSRYSNKTLDITNFTNLDILIQTKIIEYILDDNYEKNLYLVNDTHVNMIISLINNEKPNIKLNLPDNLCITKSYNILKLSRDTYSASSYNIELKSETLLPNGHTIKIIDNSEDTSNYCLRLNSKEIKLPLYVRNRTNGDKMTIKNMTSYKKIKDIYINSKLPISERESYPIVIDSNNEILWLPGLKKSKFDKSKDANYDIILWYN